MIAELYRHKHDLESRVTVLRDEEWRPTRFLVQAEVKLERALGDWFLRFDVIHHRGQLSTDLRPMYGKGPPIYGPSGDSA